MEKFIKDITKKAGHEILKKFGKIGVKYTKIDAADVVTEADLISNKIIIEAIKNKYPTHSIISEETGEYQSGNDYCWVIDPLDGTRNFSTKTPLFVVIVSLIYKGKVKFGAIYNPCTDEMLFAEQGKGAFLNNKKVHCSNQKTWENSWGLTSCNVSGKSLNNLQKLLKFAEKKNFWTSSLGSSGVSTIYQADGRRDWRFSAGGGLWDYAAPALILKEAGCKVTNYKGKPWSIKDREILAANKNLHPILLKIINSK